MKTKSTIIPITLAVLAATASGLVLPTNLDGEFKHADGSSGDLVNKKPSLDEDFGSLSKLFNVMIEEADFDSPKDKDSGKKKCSGAKKEGKKEGKPGKKEGKPGKKGKEGKKEGKKHHKGDDDDEHFESDLKKLIKKFKKALKKAAESDNDQDNNNGNVPKDLASFYIKDLIESTNGELSLAPIVNEESHKNDYNIMGEKENDVNLKNKKNPLIPNRYMIVFKKNLSLNEMMFHKELINEINMDFFFNQQGENKEKIVDFSEPNEFGIAAKSKHGGIESSFDIGEMFQGYVGYFSREVIDLIRMTPLVEYVEQDSIVFASDFDTQNGAPWGLARISHREKLNLGSFNKYLYDDDAGKGVTAYVIDTGVNVEHEQFEGRAQWGATMPSGDEDVDGNGHGTHCAGTIGAKDYGVAKNANIVAVKVLRSNGSGTMSDVVRGVEYAANAHVKESKDKKNKNFKGSTANMSLGGGKSPSLDLAVNAAVDAGIHFAVAAGNENQDACNTSPASAEKAITVGASTLSDARAYFSNYGSCVDIFAPGLNILSTYIGSDTATAVLSGTSMASPHVAGLLTYYLSLQPDSDSAFYDDSLSNFLTPALLKQKVIDFATPDVLDDIDSESPNLLIYNGAGEDLSGFWSPKAGSVSASASASTPKSSKISSAESELGFQLSLDSIVESLSDSTDNLFEDVRNVIKGLDIF